MSRRTELRAAAALLLALLLAAPLSAQMQVRETQSMDSWFLAANEAYGRGDFKEAARLYRLSIQNGQREAFSWFNLGNTLVQLGKNPLAMVAYRRCLELAPGFSRAWVQLGDLLFFGGEYSEAAGAYTRALELDGSDKTHVHAALGEIALRSGAWTDAQFQFERALARDPDRAELWFALAEAYEGLQDWDAAIETLKSSLERSPSAGAETWFRLGLLHEKTGNLKAMRRAFDEGLALDPGNVAFRIYLARSWSAEGAPWMAVFTLEEGLSRGADRRDDSDLRLELANTLFAQKRFDEALEQYRVLARRGDPLGRAGIENVAGSWWNAGDTARAGELLKEIR